MNFKTYSGLNENSAFTQKPDSYRKFFGVIVFLSIISLFLLACTPEPTFVIENGRVIIDNGTVLEQASVVVAGDSIYSVTQEPVDAPDTRRIDASGNTILPGLIDAHVHLTIPPDGRDSTALAKHLEENIPTILNGFLDHGITTVRSTGDYWPSGRKLRNQVTDGELEGPRIITSGPLFTTKVGHPASTICTAFWSEPDLDGPDPNCRSHFTREVRGPNEARGAVQQLAKEGADYIKVVSDSIIAPVQIDEEIVEIIVEEAHHREGLRAMGHV